MGTIQNVTSSYSAIESWLYDRVIAPAVIELNSSMFDSFVGKLSASASVLEVGCGGGQLICQLLERQSDLKITGLDLSKEQVSRARKRVAKSGLQAKFVQGSALSLPFENDQFDFVLSLGSIKHWPNQEKGVSECVRVLRPGGMLVIAEIDKNCDHNLAIDFVSKWKMPNVLKKPALHFFTKKVANPSLNIQEANALLETQQLEEFSVEPITNTPAFIMYGKKASQTNA